MQRVVNCKLSIKSIINDKEDIFVCEGKGYYKNDTLEITVYFASNDSKYKYVYCEESLTVFCNNSKYTFKKDIESIGEIKSDEYTFIFTTLAKKIEINNNCIVLDYELYQDGLIGTYYSVLSFN